MHQHSAQQKEKRKKAKTCFALFALPSLKEVNEKLFLDALDQCAQCLGGDHYRLHLAINHHMAALQVRLPGALARVQRVTTRLPKALMLACEVTLCHREITSCYFRKTF
jgi:hypothetical protein